MLVGCTFLFEGRFEVGILLESEGKGVRFELEVSIYDVVLALFLT